MPLNTSGAGCLKRINYLSYEAFQIFSGATGIGINTNLAVVVVSTISMRTLFTVSRIQQRRKSWGGQQGVVVGTGWIVGLGSTFLLSLLKDLLC